MKKYLLNYVIVGAMALLTVVGLQSFDKAAKAEKASPAAQQDCEDELIWIRVQPGLGIECDLFSTIATSRLILHDVLSSDPLDDMDDFMYDQDEASGETGCIDNLPFTCAVGYAADANNFVGVDGKWVPQDAPVCKVCRIIQ